MSITVPKRRRGKPHPCAMCPTIIPSAKTYCDPCLVIRRKEQDKLREKTRNRNRTRHAGSRAHEYAKQTERRRMNRAQHHGDAIFDADGRQIPVERPGRRCDQCGSFLSGYNRNDSCLPCLEARRQALIAANIARAAA